MPSQIWVVCDAQLSLHRETDQWRPREEPGDVTDGLRGDSVMCDNFFTSYEFGQQLLKWITIVSTVILFNCC